MKRVILIGSFVLGLTTFGFAQVTVTIPDTSANRGESITIPVNVSGLTGLGVISYQFTLVFDEDVLDATGASSEGTLTASWGAPAVNTNNNGEIEVGGYTTADTLTGSGTLVNLNFNVVGDIGDSTNLRFSFFAIFGFEGELPADTSIATFRVNSVTVVVTTNIDGGSKVIVDNTTYPAPHTFYWSPGSSHSISVESPQLDGAGTRYLFSSWSDGGTQTHIISATTDSTFTANMITQYYLTVSSDKGDPQGEGWYDADSVATFWVTSPVSDTTGIRHVFSSWTGIGSGSYTGTDNPATVVMISPITEEANWITQYYLTVDTNPPGLTNIPGSGWYDEDSTASTGTAPVSIDTGGVTYDFQGWILDDSLVADNPISILMDAPHTAIANYSPFVSVTVTTSIGSGTRVIVDGVVEDAPYTAIWGCGSPHTIGVESQQSGGEGIRYVFSSWSDGGTQTHSVSPIVSTNYVAEMISQCYLTVKTDPPGLVTLNGSGWYDLGDTVTTETVPIIVVNEGKRYKFMGWVIDSSFVSDNPVSLVMDFPHTAVAKYQVVYQLSGKVILYGKGLPGTEIILSGSKTDTLSTDENGYYFFDGLPQGSYSVTPEKVGVCFEPSSRSYAPLDSDYVNQNFTAIDVLAPEVILLSPNGGENYMPGQQDTIRWIATDNVDVNCVSLYFSSNGGTNWEIISAHEANDSSFQWCVPDIISNSCRIKIVAYDHGGNFAWDISDDDFSISPAAVREGATTTVPRVFSLSQNYPNPFVPTEATGFWSTRLTDSPGTCIQYGLPQATKVTLEIFNLLGQRIRTLKDEFQSPGYYVVYWDGKDESGKLLPSGIYIYQLEVEGVTTLRKKMMLLR